MNLLSRQTTISPVPYSEFNYMDFALLATNEQIDNFSITYCQMIEINNRVVKFQDFKLNNKERLVNVNLTSTQGIDWSNSIINLERSELLATFNVSNCGLETIEVNDLIIKLSNNINSGMGQARSNTKTITINGANNKAPDLLIQAVADAKANLISKGWVVNHN